jgi:hypothetical protein
VIKNKKGGESEREEEQKFGENCIVKSFTILTIFKFR